ncbi:alpha-amylase catalictic domain containing protein [Monocercomonoides exilis]|uniref:alpha-amylase catalictic domain containing protein n=1 Tax=Monocercomonoides exilis TaxID=2049356 RepID=UPI003559F1CA|nr:alpha-amylase catalictic domain containing protein [Monocercomonoides exilis]|eukprot:MONOS_10739.1-p1 / transcript=MONOS_10739.1 / gene=MONOS_10739 / organism=Monocercomonoides_exilis_PA203 / gene_product=alpha-amylase catalictic domain containing protein / transcript_product=alpha-amylase catalictic domain containing protein / location=Mono_scaffold00500:1096-2481(+) / protein_length=462 / sequence_SO=supercontig / SO=protein_coding / is_pseudo=false
MWAKIALYVCAAIASTICEENVQLGRTNEEWKTRVIYQILTDRFARSDDRNASCSLGSYCGGTYRGIINHLDYIQDLGMNAIWISPIVENTPGSYHGYHATNFYALNTNYGNESEFREFLRECKKRDIWVMVDLVFNHAGPVGTDFSKIYPFNKAEHYHDWCDVSDWHNQWQVENCRIAGLPDLKQENTYVKDELIKWCKWIISNYSLDGIRIDTIKHVPVWFWKELEQKVPGIYKLGEVFDGSVQYLKPYADAFPGHLSYPMYYTLMNVYAYRQSCYQIRQRFEEYANANIDVTLLGGFVDNHDNKRWLNINGDWKSLKNALAFNILSASIPLVYYGSDQGFKGGDDPQNREPLWAAGWNKNHELYKFIAVAAKQRQKINPKDPHVERFVDDVFYAFSRGSTLVCTTNQYNTQFSRNVTYLPFKAGDKIRELYSGATQTVLNTGITITMRNGQPQIWIKV